ncbi:hypothetical protein TW65_04480 [Stemphylium lycopersici]|uniref:Uncharacterized protein n=1 Tax=Stemphylium lycopersici TaxID=183478 RepID=A0A364N180_STELY|nr:hypothetical protein TW65_04480 [Stemphylium lycopersici]RAR08894.1 hypothetical protein DDE83_005812 [Stemphylium lycopersici]
MSLLTPRVTTHLFKQAPPDSSLQLAYSSGHSQSCSLSRPLFDFRMSTAAAIRSSSPLGDKYEINSRDNIGIVAVEPQEIVPSEPTAVMVPCLNSSPSSDNSSASPHSSDSASTAPTSPASDGIEGPILWRNCDLIYLIGILQAEERTSSTFIFTPSLEDLDHATLPIHLQLHKRTSVSIPPGFEAYVYSKHAPIGTGRPTSRILIAESSHPCRNPFEARRSLAGALLSNSYAVNAEMNKCNVIYSLHCTTVPALESMLRAMYLMMTIPDAEWLSRLAQLRGMVDGKFVVPGVGDACTLQAQIEYYLLDAGRGGLDGWIKCLGMCLNLGDEGRRAWAQVYGDAARFLARARDEFWKTSG